LNLTQSRKDAKERRIQNSRAKAQKAQKDKPQMDTAVIGDSCAFAVPSLRLCDFA
jgi:hypothetical protein